MKQAADLNRTSCDAQAWAGFMLSEAGMFYESIPYWKVASYRSNCSTTYFKCLDSLLTAYRNVINEHKELTHELAAAEERGRLEVLYLQQQQQQQQKSHQQHHKKRGATKKKKSKSD